MCVLLFIYGITCIGKATFPETVSGLERTSRWKFILLQLHMHAQWPDLDSLILFNREREREGGRHG